jgi:hypothetical protein
MWKPVWQRTWHSDETHWILQNDSRLGAAVLVGICWHVVFSLFVCLFVVLPYWCMIWWCNALPCFVIYWKRYIRVDLRSLVYLFQWDGMLGRYIWQDVKRGGVMGWKVVQCDEKRVNLRRSNVYVQDTFAVLAWWASRETWESFMKTWEMYQVIPSLISFEVYACAVELCLF